MYVDILFIPLLFMLLLLTLLFSYCSLEIIALNL